MNLSNINPNLPQIPANYGPSSQQVHNYVTHHISSSQSSQQQQVQNQQQQSQQQNTGSTSQQQNVYQSSSQQFTPWGQYPTTCLGTGITDNIAQQRLYAGTTTTNTHSTPNSYTGEFYGNDDHQQSLGFGAMSVTSSIINQPPHTLQAVSTIQSALNNLNSSQLGISSAPSLVAAAPPIPVNTIHSINNNNNIINNKTSQNENNKENMDKNIVEKSNMSNPSSNITNINVATVNVSKPNDINNTNNVNITNNNNASSNFYLAPGSANHGGSYRQTLNPAIYNAYRTSSNNTGNGRGNNNNISTLPVTGHRINNNKSPVVHVIAETVYRIPNIGVNGCGIGMNGLGLNGRMAFRKQDRFDKTALYKTELCTNWMLTGSCTYGNKCHFAHGVEDLKPRMRVENYKTQPCCDPAREGCRRCMYGRRCNYCHPGEAIRRPHPTPYYDKDYYNALRRDFGQDNEFPFGIYV